MSVPTGSDSATVADYYDHLYEKYLSAFAPPWEILWVSLGLLVFWVVLMAGGGLLAARWQRRTRSGGEPYPIETYDGYISEGNGPVGRFLTVFFAGIVLWAMAITIARLSQGQIY